MNLRREMSYMFFALSLLSAVGAQVANVTLMAVTGGVIEGETAEVCIGISDGGILDPNNPPTVRISTAESETGDDFVPLEDDVMLVRGDEECFDIPTIDDDVVEPSESFMVLLSNANGVTIVDGTVSIRIADNGDLLGVDFRNSTLAGTEGEEVQVCIVVTRGSHQLPAVNVDVEIDDITTDLSDRVLFVRTINIPVGADVGNTFCTTITLSEDRVVEQAEETFSVSLVPPGTGALAVDIPDTIKTVTITDGDRGNVRINTLSVMEGNSTNTATIAIELLSILLQRPVAYRVQLTSGTATAGADFENLPNTEVTFPINSVQGDTQVVMVQIIGDEVGEPDETFNIVLEPTNPDGDDGMTATITIIDDEQITPLPRATLITSNSPQPTSDPNDNTPHQDQSSSGTSGTVIIVTVTVTVCFLLFTATIVLVLALLWVRRRKHKPEIVDNVAYNCHEREINTTDNAAYDAITNRIVTATNAAARVPSTSGENVTTSKNAAYIPTNIAVSVNADYESVTNNSLEEYDYI